MPVSTVPPGAPARFRDTAIEAIGQIPWGTHFCVFYESKQDLLDLLVPFFASGLTSGEFCMWVTSEPLDADEARDALAAAVPDLAQYEERSAIEILPYSQWYVVDGVFDQARVLDGWVQRLDAALARGFAGLRLTGNTFWLEKSQWQDFQDYELAVNDVIGRYDMLAMCTYSLAKCNALEVIDVVQAHQFALVKRDTRWVLIENSSSKQAAEAIRLLNIALEDANRSLVDSNRDLYAANENLKAFSYSVSHDLRTPLRAIDGYAHILLEDHAPALDDTAQHLLRGIGRSATKMAQLIDDILAYSRAGREALSREPVDMTKLVDEVLAEQREADSGRTVDVIVGALHPVVGDPNLLRQVWANLISNAFKFSATVSEPRVEISSDVEGESVVYRVRDNGVGFDPGYAERLFRVFQRMHGPEFAGTGVGLAIVESIVTRHGGTVHAESEVGNGAVFSFALPAASGADSARLLPA